jgi:hypothetical protein
MQTTSPTAPQAPLQVMAQLKGILDTVYQTNGTLTEVKNLISKEPPSVEGKEEEATDIVGYLVKIRNATSYTGVVAEKIKGCL